MLRPRTLLGVALSAMLAASAQAQDAPAPRPQGESVAAAVNDEIISTYDLRQRLLLLIVQSGVQPTEQQYPQYEREALRSLIDERLQLQELRNEETKRKIPGKLVASDAQVDAAVARIAQQSQLTSEQLEAALNNAGVGIGTLRERLRAQLSWDNWISNLYGRRMRVGQDQIASTIRRINEASSRPQYLISEIFLDASRVGGQADAVQGAEQLIAQIQQGAPFAAVARQFSAAATAASGGDAGWLQETEIPATVLPTVLQMRAGQISQPIPVADGVYIVQLRDKRAGAAATVVSLKQAAVQLAPDAPQSEVQAAQTKLLALKTQIMGCEGLETRAGAVQGVIAGDLGEAELEDLDAQFRTVAERLNPGQVSDPIRTSVGLHLVAVCAKRTGGAAAPSADEVEDRLFGEQLAMVSRRYMRDLRNSATIESR